MADETTMDNRASTTDVDALASRAPGARQTSNGRNAKKMPVTDSPHGIPGNHMSDEERFPHVEASGDSRERRVESTRAFVTDDKNPRPTVSQNAARIRGALQTTTQTVKSNPWVSLTAAAGLGAAAYLLLRLVSRRRSAASIHA